MSGAAVRKLKSRGAVISLITTTAIIAALVATLLGTGFFNTAVATHDAAAWLWTATSGELSHVNGETGRVDTRHELTDSQGHDVEVIQTDEQILLRDLDTGVINALDPATLQITGTAETPPGEGVNVALHDGKAFIVDSVQGLVHQVDPRTLTPIGDPLRFAAGLTGGVFDNDGKLWFAVPKEGTLVGITAGADGAPAQVSDTIAVAEPSHKLAISVLRDGVAVLDSTGAKLTTVHAEDVRTVDVPVRGLAIMPVSTDSTVATITVTDGRDVYAVDGTDVKEYEVPGEGAELGAAVEWWGRIYVADNASDKIYVFDADGKLLDPLELPAGDGGIQLLARDGHLFVNAPHTNNALVVDEDHKVMEVDKGVGGVLGADVPPEEKPKQEKPKDEKTEPGAPRNIRAVPGDGSATLSWNAAPNNGSAIIKYVIEGALGKPVEVAGDQQVVKLTGLDNGTQYKLTVYAVNGVGAGPKGRANPVVPTADVPDAPASVTAVAQPDGTVKVTWPAADGQGNEITGYKVDTVGAGGASRPVGQVGAETTMVVPAGKLEYGTQYAFTVTAIAESGAASDPSPPSATVVPFTTPEAPRNLKAVTVPDQKGTVKATWSAAVANGRAVTGYKVTAKGKTQTVTGLSAVIGGLGDGQVVQVQVVAVNEAGDGKPASTTAETVRQPTVSISGTSGGSKSVTVKFSTNDGGGMLSCKATAGGKSASGNCTSLTINGVYSSSSYTVKVTVSNAAGSASASKKASTSKVTGTVRCINGPSGEEAVYCNTGIRTYTSPSQNGTKTEQYQNGDKLTGLCKAKGQMVYAYRYNNDKKSDLWIKIKEGGGDSYIPWAWLNLQSGDNTGLLPTC